MKPAQLVQVLEPVYGGFFCCHCFFEGFFLCVCLLVFCNNVLGRDGSSRSECTSIFVLMRNHLVLGIMMQLKCAMTVSFSMTM